MSDIFQRLQSAQSAIESIVPDQGGILRCETCQKTAEPKGEYMSVGWPKCCGHTMHWWTQRQIDEGEMPVGGDEK